MWGFHPANGIEHVHKDVCKRMFEYQKGSTNGVVLNGLRRVSLHIVRKIRIAYWLKLLKTINCIVTSSYEDMF